ncbi:hypothetical protein [Clostridium sp.]|uniref:hypothetical protein n=1 Tax=Clostridium sp. TaxID=1506 RepID=UPI0028492B40|nr:hypothetical protein [Clostridium sp.]MDR3597071.1 hypothetical protein [Clostridium sp.]
MLTKLNLELMLNLLDISTLERIDSKCRQDNYLYGQRPLLKYTKEALTEYAGAIYRYILPHFGTITTTEAEYLALWLAPYTAIQLQLKAKEPAFIGTIIDIVMHPIAESDPNIIVTPRDCLYAQIANFLIGNDSDLYADVLDFLCNVYSPLRKDTVTDPRVLDLIAEVDAMRATYDSQLEAFISKETKKYISLCKSRLDYLNLSSKDITQLTKHRANLPQKEWSIVEQALASENLSTKAKSAFTKLKKLIKDAHKLSAKHPKLREISKTKNLLSDADYIIIKQLLKSTADWNLDADRIIALYKVNSVSCLASPEYKALCAKVDIASHLAHYINSTQQECAALTPYVELVNAKTPDSAKQLLSSQSAIHIVTADIHKLFISSFALNVESEYSKLEPISIFALEDILNDALAESQKADQNAIYQNYNITLRETAQKRQEMLELLASNGHTENWFDDYTNIAKPLSDCLAIVLNDLTPVPEALEHGAIVGMLSWCEQVKSKLIAVAEGKALAFDYKSLAQELRDKMQYHTLANNTTNYLKVTDAELILVEDMSTEYIQDRVSSLAKPTDLLVHNVTYGIVKVCNPSPLPNVVPTNAEPQLDTEKYINKNFNRAEKYWVHIEGLRPDTMFTRFVEKSLSDDEVKALKPVNDRAIQRLLPLFAGTQCTAYMLRGDLYTHTVQGEYLKILPSYSPKEGYAKYEFMTVNWNTLKSLINRYADLLRDTDEYEDIIATISIRQSFDDSDSYGVSRKERLANRYRQYCKDVKFLYELKATAETRYKDTEKEALVYSLSKTFVNTYSISQAYLSVWVYKTEEYAQKLAQVQIDVENDIIEYQIHHDDYNPRNNDPDNLIVYDKDTHDDLKRNCIPVIYNGHTYPSITKYCNSTNAGVYTKLQQALLKLQIGGTVTYKGRNYSIDKDTNKITATDSETTQKQGTQVDFNGTGYPNLSDFAKAANLKSAAALRKRLSRAEKDGDKEFVYNGLKFTLNGANKVTVTI